MFRRETVRLKIVRLERSDFDMKSFLISFRSLRVDTVVRGKRDTTPEIFIFSVALSYHLPSLKLN